MKAEQNTTRIADLLGRSTFKISFKLRRNVGARGYCHEQACELFHLCARDNCKAALVAPWPKEQVTELLKLRCSPKQVAGKLPAIHDTPYPYVYTDKTSGGKLWKKLRSQKQNKMRYPGGIDRGWRVPNGRPLSQRPAYVQGRKQVGRWEGNTAGGANHKQAIVTFADRKRGHSVIKTVSNQTFDLIGAAIKEVFQAFEARVKTQTYSNNKEFCGHAQMDYA